MQHPVEGLVAKTESYRPANFANLQAWQKSGDVSTVKWYTAEDDRVCPQWLKNFYGDCKRAKKPFQAVLHFREAPACLKGTNRQTRDWLVLHIRPREG
jgi:hypothetical protein